MSISRIRHPQKLGDKLTEPDVREASFIVLFDGWVDDLQRLHASLLQHLGPHDWELVVVDNPVDDDASERIAGLERVVHIPLRDPVGWGAGRNLGLRQATGKIAIVVDTSVEVDGDLIGPIERQLDDPTTGAVGRWGVVSRDGYHFEESDGPEVDGVEAYLIAMRRSDLASVGLFDAKFKWYRNADIDLSFKFRDAGLRTIVDPTLAVVRHEHRLWEATPETERDELSRRNFFRFRNHWGDRKDLFVAVDREHGG